MAQKLVVIDVPPLEHAEWVSQVFAKAHLTPVSNDAVSDAMGADPAAQKALLASTNAVMEAEKLAPHYRKAFEKLYGTEPRLGLWGSAWVVYTPNVDACIVDWSEVERLAAASKPGESRAPYEQFKKTSYDFIRARVQKHLAPEKYLELPLGLTSQQKIDATIAFLKKRGLID